MNYDNDKLNEIYHATWPNLGWAKMKDDAPWLDTTYDGFMTHEEMLEEAERREVANKELQKEEWERKERSDTVLQRYNAFYNLECSGLPHGTPITPEHQQMITLQSMIDALRCENLNREYNEIAISDIEDLIEALDGQATAFLKRVREFKDSADGVA
jgi:hypothetical protein